MQNRNRYPENWVDTIRPSILKRDNYKCTSCGVKHRQYVARDGQMNRVYIDVDEVYDFRANGWRVSRVYLQVAHIDQNPANCNPDNLTTKCPKCHFELDRRHNIIKRIGQLCKPFNSSGQS